jgi:hypothetical protein
MARGPQVGLGNPRAATTNRRLTGAIVRSVAASADELTAVIDLRLYAEPDNAYQPPGAGSRSLLYVFDGQQIWALAATADGRDLLLGRASALVPLAAHTRFLWRLLNDVLDEDGLDPKRRCCR